MSIPQAVAPQQDSEGADSLQPRPRSMPTTWDYETLRQLIRHEPLPLALVDLDRFEQNVREFSQRASAAQKTIRVASKSIRVPDLLRRVFSAGGPVMQGIMCYCAEEAGLLADQGFDDLLIGYPTCQARDVEVLHRLAQSGKKAAVIIDSRAQVEAITVRWRELGGDQPLRVCIEVDISWRPWGIHIGAQRSPLRSLAAVGDLLDDIARHPELRLVGCMTYEAHLAGVRDSAAGSPLRNLAVQTMKAWATPRAADQRKRLAELFEKRKISLELVNGGGTGSFSFALRDPWLTEVTVGSGFLQSHLFDGYPDVFAQPALLFALPITRTSQPDRVTCHSGGFIASGSPGSDRLPLPVLPAGVRIDPQEGCGEVQTPLIVPQGSQGRLSIGDPVFFRPAKAGELAEHFAEYLVLQGGRISGRMKTYRGLGCCFH